MKIDLDKVQSRLFEKDAVRGRILRDFGVAEIPVDDKHFVKLLIDALKQPVAAQPLAQTLTNVEVFRAASWALGSNSRNWCDFVRNEGQLRILLGGYDPLATVQSLKRGPQILNDIKVCLKGQTSGRDTENMLRWANILSQNGDFYKEIVSVGQKIRTDYSTLNHETIDDFDLALCLVGHFADKSCSQETKFPGMSYALASECFKNLGWSIFKPDRHIKRLLDRWFAHPNTNPINQKKLDSLESLILGGRKSAELRTFLRYSMLGKAVTPVGSVFSQVDNVVWLLGKYVERKGKETSTLYVI